MANSAKVSIQFRDSMGRTTNRVYGLSEAASVADAATDAAALAALLDATSELGLNKVVLLWDCDVSATAPTAGSNIDEGGTVSGWIEEYKKKASLKVPAPIAAARVADGTLLLTNATLKAFLDEFIVTTGTATLSDGETIASWIKGVVDAK
jgi:hypothetical protein